MKDVWTCIQLGLAAVGGFFGWFFGGFDGFLYALLVFVVADYITGVMCAIADKKLSSEVGFKGICKKVLIFVMVGIGHIMDTYLIGNGECCGQPSSSSTVPTKASRCLKTPGILDCPFRQNSRIF